MKSSDFPAGSGLTTTEAAFIEQAQKAGEIYIAQPYELYSPENHQTWNRLYTRMLPRWRKYANPRFLQGIDSLCFNPERVPRLEEINKFLHPLSGFSAKAVSGYIPSFQFFDCLRTRAFPTTVTIRSARSLDYLPEPDLFHDIAGHVPMHTDRAFADVLVRFGEVARAAAFRVQNMVDEDETAHLQRIESILRAMARFFWFTIEFGLMKTPGSTELKAYGSGLLSSYSELENAITGPVQRYPFQIEWVINQGFDIDHFQPLLFVVDSFEHLFEQVDLLLQWVQTGKVDHVAPGEPGVNEADLKSYLHAEVGAANIHA